MKHKFIAIISFILLSLSAFTSACSSIIGPETHLTPGTLAQHIKKDAGDKDVEASPPSLLIEISDATKIDDAQDVEASQDAEIEADIIIEDASIILDAAEEDLNSNDASINDAADATLE